MLKQVSQESTISGRFSKRGYTRTLPAQNITFVTVHFAKFTLKTWRTSAASVTRLQCSSIKNLNVNKVFTEFVYDHNALFRVCLLVSPSTYIRFTIHSDYVLLSFKKTKTLLVHSVV